METYRTKTFKTFIVVFLAFFSFGCDDSFNALNTDKKVTFSYNPDDRSLKVFDEPFLIFFYSSSCGYCKEQAKYLKDFENSFKMIGVIGDKPKKENALKHTHELNIPIIYEYAGVKFLSSAVGEISAVPVLVFYDKNGKIIKRYSGLVSKQRLENQIFAIKHNK